MSLEAILAAIRTSGEACLAEIDCNSRTQVEAILEEAHAEACKLKEQACAKAAAPAARHRAQILQRARLEGLQLTGEARETLIDNALVQVATRLEVLRNQRDYPIVLRRLVTEALAEIKASFGEINKAWLSADLRDQESFEKILADLGFNLKVSYNLDCWGGLIARSEDERIVVINTLEARLERANPHLRRHLAAFFEASLVETNAAQIYERSPTQ